MNIDLTNKNALVCGSTKGIGYAIAMQLAKCGANVTLMARNGNLLQSIVRDLDTSLGQKHDFLVADFSQPKQVKEAIEVKAQKHHIYHILVNNSGGPAAGLAIDAKEEDFLNAFNAHVLSSHHLVQSVFPGMKQAGYGRIINIISTSVKAPLANLGVSNTIRAAVANWAKTLANELGKFNITVNNVLPGATNTSRLSEIAGAKSLKTGQTVSEIFEEMGGETPMNRIAEPEEVAAAVCFLASPEASYINGINLPVDGGRTKCL
jgi:3-oxoacyl-[acyl-carrier protein] reductase